MRPLVLLLCSLALSTALAQNAPVLPNADFEETPLGWTSWPAESKSLVELDPTVAQHGRQSLRITAREAGDRIFVLNEIKGLEAGRIYRITVHLRKDALVGDSVVSFFINWRDPQTGAIKERAQPSEVRVTPAGEWTRQAGLFLVPPGNMNAQFLLGVEHTAGRVWFDNILIENLGLPSEQQADVWSNVTMGVEIGSGPLSRFSKHKTENDWFYQSGARYNDLVFQDAFAESLLRDIERCSYYAGKDAPAALRERYTSADEQLNRTYLAYAKAFETKGDPEKAAFTAEADRLTAQVVSLKAELEAALSAIRPRTVPFPEHFGVQPRDVRAIRPDGRMDRLLFGAWSPTQFSEWEKPFDLEFHSSAPGVPKTHTETEVDFSNITTACDDLQKLGYAGTFGYLVFGQHEYMYAPQWLIEKYKDEPDFYKLSQDGLKGGSNGSNHSLNWIHPAVRDYIKDYLTKYASFCKKEPRVLFYEVDQEAYPDFSTSKGMRQTGYGPQGEKHFRLWLQARHKNIAALNREWGTTYASFEAIEPPRDAYLGRGAVTPLIAEFEAYRDDAYLAYLKLIYQSLKAGDPDKPVVARHSALLNLINGAHLFETCDVLSYHRGAPQMQLGHVYLNSLNRYAKRGLGYMEDFWGKQEEGNRVWDERAQRRGLEKHISRCCTWGRTLQMKWYAYTAGPYIFQYNGNWFNPKYDLTTIRYCAPALAVAKRKMEQLDWIITHSQIAPSKVLVLQPSATMRNERPQQTVYGELLNLHARLFKLGVLYELLPEEYFQFGAAKLSDFRVIILPRARYLAPDLQQQLVQWVKSGGLLVLIGENGTFDHLGRPCDLIGKAAGVDTASAGGDGYFRGGKHVKLGEGGVWHIPSLAGMTDYMDLRKMAMSGARYPVQGYYLVEHVLRVTEDGQRYLFVTNPNVDREEKTTVELEFPVREAIDVFAPGGFPVPVVTQNGRAAIKLRLGPGETTVIWLR